MAYNPIIARRQQPKPTLSALPDTQPARGSTIVLVGGDPNKTYTYVPQSDYQTISYSDTMKNKAEDYTKSKSTGERIAGNLYLGADKAASAYEEFVSPVTKTFDVTTPVNTGRPAQDFLANAGRGFINTFVSAPADIARVTGASGLSLAMLGKTNAKKGAEIVASGVPNFVGAQAESFAANPGAFVGGVAAGVVGGKAVGKVASAGKKRTTTQKSKSKKTVVLDTKNKSAKQRVGEIKAKIQKKKPTVIINTPKLKTPKKPKNSLGLRAAVKGANIQKKIQKKKPTVIINTPKLKTPKKPTQFTTIDGDTLRVTDISGKVLFEAPSPEVMRKRNNTKKDSNTGKKSGNNTGKKTDYSAEVDAGNGMMMKTRGKSSETGSQKQSKSTSQKGKSKSSSKNTTPKNPRKDNTKSASGEKKVQKRDAVKVFSAGQTELAGKKLKVTVSQTQTRIQLDGDTPEKGTTSTTKDTSTSTTTNAESGKSQQKVSSRVKSASKSKTETANVPKTRRKTATTTTVKPVKKPKPVKSIEEDKKKQRKKIKKMKEEAYRLETVNTFGWITDKKPAAKPRRIK